MTGKGNRKFYITTAIDYVNSVPHIGTAYEKIGADVLARWHRMMGFDVRFQMGNDEHSINVWKAARERGLTPKAYCDEMRKKFEDVWRSLEISYDGFIQTSDPHHEAGVQRIFSKIIKNGDIYKSRYEGWYCESCEAYFTDKDLVDGLCPNHKSKPKWLSEENYFFALSKYKDLLLKHIEENPGFILPDIRRNEIVSLLEEGLQDISVSRSSFDWGVKLPDDPGHIVYVWFDALINYITAVGYGWDEKMKERWWPADMHVIGKDITRFHCVIWPAMLMSAGIPLPQTIFGHGFVYLKGEKMSKTLGNVVTPMDIIDHYGADPLRYYLLREGSFGRDGDFTWEHFIERYNGDLANGIGNLVSRTIGMATRYQDGNIQQSKSYDSKSEIALAAAGLPERISNLLDHRNGDIEFHHALAAIWDVIAAADRHINEHKPWEMAKAGKTSEINDILWGVASSLHAIAIMLYPFMPSTAENIWKACGFDACGAIGVQTLDSARAGLGKKIKKLTVAKAANLFPRIEDKTAPSPSPLPWPPQGRPWPPQGRPRGLPAMQALQAGERVTMENTLKKETKMEPNLIDIQDFAQVDLRIAQVLEAEPVEGTDKLMRLVVDLGVEKRQIVAGIAKHYTAGDLIGKKIVVVANLKPAKLKGIESNGMLLAASDKDTVSILTPLKDVEVGSRVK